MSQPTKFPEVYPAVESGLDKVHTAIDYVASLAPGGSVLFNRMVNNPVIKRTQNWMNEVERRIVALEEKEVISLTALENSEHLSALLLKLCHAAEVTSEREMLDSLANFAVNIAREPDLETDRRYMLIEVLKGLTPSHVKLLDLYCNPMSFKNEIIANPHIDLNQMGLEAATLFGEPDNHEFWALVYRQVSANFLIELGTQSLYEKSPEYFLSAKPTALGRELYRMIRTDDNI